MCDHTRTCLSLSFTQATLDGMGLSGRTVSVQDFVSALTNLLSHLTTDELDSAIIGVVDKRKVSEAV